MQRKAESFVSLPHVVLSPQVVFSSAWNFILGSGEKKVCKEKLNPLSRFRMLFYLLKLFFPRLLFRL